MNPHGWRDRAACRGQPLARFYPERWERFDAQPALTICRRCPVRAPCLDDALAHEDGERRAFGIRGGYTSAERTEMLRHRPRLEVVAVVEVEVELEQVADRLPLEDSALVELAAAM